MRGGSSSGHSTTCGQAKSSRRAETIATLTQWLAPGATAIWLRPSGSTTMSAVPVAASVVENSPATPMPSAARRARIAVPAASSPTHPMNLTSAPSRRAATAWLAPLPPWLISRVPPVTVSPGAGRRGAETT